MIIYLYLIDENEIIIDITYLNVALFVNIRNVSDLNQTANDDDMELTGIIIPSINCSQSAIGSSKTTTTTTTIANFVDKSFNATNPDMELTCVLDDQKMSNNQSIDEAQIDDCNQTSKLINISNVDMEITGLNGSDQDTASPVPLAEPLIPCAVPFTAPQIEIPTGSVHKETVPEEEEEGEKVIYLNLSPLNNLHIFLRVYKIRTPI